MPQIISRADVKKHHDESSNWIIIHDNVYDVSSFMDEHPGGADSLLEVAGQDGTQGFEDVGHSDDARELLKKYLIGTLPPEEKSKVKPCPTTCCPHLPRREIEGRTWRTYDGSPSSRSSTPKSQYKRPTTPRPERRVQAITVPRESPSNLKWALLALAGALVIGVVLKKYLNK